jgi:hypothetical protein
LSWRDLRFDFTIFSGTTFECPKVDKKHSGAPGELVYCGGVFSRARTLSGSTPETPTT